MYYIIILHCTITLHYITYITLHYITLHCYTIYTILYYYIIYTITLYFLLIPEEENAKNEAQFRLKFKSIESTVDNYKLYTSAIKQVK